MTDVDAPERIGLIHSMFGYRLWTRESDEGIPASVEYVRADLFAASEAARIKAEGEVERLREVLEPFAKHIDEMKFDIDNKGNPLPDDQAVGWVYVTNGDFRAARAALRREPSTALEHGKTEGGGE